MYQLLFPNFTCYSVLLLHYMLDYMGFGFVQWYYLQYFNIPHVQFGWPRIYLYIAQRYISMIYSQWHAHSNDILFPKSSMLLYAIVLKYPTLFSMFH